MRKDHLKAGDGAHLKCKLSQYVVFFIRVLTSSVEVKMSQIFHLISISGSVRSRATLGRLNLRRLDNQERPLMIALNNCLRQDCDSVFVLQENDPGEIDWNSFSMPELKNFLLILDREEAWYKRKIHEKYEIVHEHMKTLAEQKKTGENGE